MSRFLALMEPGATPPVDMITFLQYLPDSMSWWKREAKAIRRDQLQLYTELVNETKAKMRRGRCPDCFLTRLIEDQKRHSISDEWLGYIAGLFVSNLLRIKVACTASLTKHTRFHTRYGLTSSHSQTCTAGNGFHLQRASKVRGCERPPLSERTHAGGMCFRFFAARTPLWQNLSRR